MAIVAVALFGSRARGDADATSDIDILLVEDHGRFRSESPIRSVNVSVYNLNYVRSSAFDGDLFICHIAYEALPLYDPASLLSEVRTMFTFKESYQDEINKASDLGWFLVSDSCILPKEIYSRRVSWVARTILIAQSANERRPIFSDIELIDRYHASDFTKLLKARKLDFTKRELSELLSVFLRVYSNSSPWSHRHPTPAEAIQYFKATKNRFAQKTLEHWDKAEYSL